MVTPLQMALAASALANRGTLYRPHLVQKPCAPWEECPKTPIIVQGRADFPEAAWKHVQQGLWAVINEPGGTAHRFGKTAYTAAGKTGTAQMYSASPYRNDQLTKIPLELRDHSWFIVYAPVDQPKIACAVLIEHAPGEAVVVGRQVLDYYFSHEIKSYVAPAFN